MASRKRYYYRGRYSGYGRGKLVKKAKGNLIASKRATDVATFTVNFSYPFVLSGDLVTTSNPVRNHEVGVQALNVWDLLSRTPNFQSFKKMYDQCRIDYVKVRLNVTNSTIQTSDANKTYDIITAWDRTGVSNNDIIYKYDINDQVEGVFVTTGSRIAEYSGCTTLQLNAFQRWKQNKSVWPQSLMEKSQYVNTGDVNEWRESFNTNYLYYPLKVPTSETGADILMNSNNPAVLKENTSFPFKPTLLIGAFTTRIDSTSNSAKNLQLLTTDTKILMNAEFSVVLTFRGLKGTDSISSEDNHLYPRDPVLQDKEVTIISNGTTTVTADTEDGYDGLEQVEITTNVQPPLQSKTEVIRSNGGRLIRPDNGYYGLSDVTIQTLVPAVLESKSLTVTSNGTQTITASNGYQGIGSLELTTDVDPSLEYITKNITSNGTQTLIPGYGYEGFSKVVIKTNVPETEVNLESKSLTVTSNGTQTITPSSEYQGISSVNLTTNVQPVLQVKSNTLTSNNNYIITPSNGYDGISEAHITVDVQPDLESKSLTVTSNGTQTITPSSEYQGISSVNLTTNVQPNLQSKSLTVTSNGTQTVNPTSGYDGLSSVSINTNVQPSLERRNLTITSNGTVSIFPNSSYQGFSSVSITTNVSGQNYNIDRVYFGVINIPLYMDTLVKYTDYYELGGRFTVQLMIKVYDDYYEVNLFKFYDSSGTLGYSTTSSNPVYIDIQTLDSNTIGNAMYYNFYDSSVSYNSTNPIANSAFQMEAPHSFNTDGYHYHRFYCRSCVNLPRPKYNFVFGQ